MTRKPILKNIWKRVTIVHLIKKMNESVEYNQKQNVVNRILIYFYKKN